MGAVHSLSGFFIALALALVPPTGPDPLLPLHLTAHDVPGLVPEGKTQACEGGEALTNLYDGGYMRYVRAGVVRASRRYDKLDGVTLEMVVHQMVSPRAATAFLADLCKGIQAKVERMGRASGCAVVRDESSFGFVAARQFVVSASYDKQDGRRFRTLLEASGRRLDHARPKKIR